MERRDFLKNSSLAIWQASAFSTIRESGLEKNINKKARNIIFMVSDGMSLGTLTMADLLLQQKEGRESNWLKLYREQKAARALMDTASASSLITDSSAASSAWGGGVRVKNGTLNVNADGSFNIPILQKFKSVGKSVGCVTTVPIAHATPAGFSVYNKSRGDMDEIAMQYLSLKFDVMMGGGKDNFLAQNRKDKADLIGKYVQEGYKVVTNRSELLSLSESEDKPVLGLFNEGGLPYTLDQMNDENQKKSIPNLAELTKAAIRKLRKNKNGFVLQVEGGKVDWAAHANDVGALLYDQLAFDDAIKVAVEFAEEDKETLLIITTDHGNANPGLFYGNNANKNFERIQHFKYTNEWILNGINRNFTAAQVQERIKEANGMALTIDEAKLLLSRYNDLEEAGVYNPRKLPFKPLATIQANYTSIGWGAMDHSADFVELAMLGPGSENLKPFVKNSDLHNLMLKAAEVEFKR